MRLAAQGVADMGIMQVVRRADADKIDARAAATFLVEVAVEPFELGEEILRSNGPGRACLDRGSRLVVSCVRERLESANQRTN